MVSLRNIFNRFFRRDPNKRSKSENKEDRRQRPKSPLSLSMLTSRVSNQFDLPPKQSKRAKKYKKVNESQEIGVSIPNLQMLDHSDLLRISQLKESAVTTRRNLNDSTSKDLDNKADRTNKYLVNEPNCGTKKHHPLSAVSSKDVDLKNYSALKNKHNARILSSLPVNQSIELGMSERSKNYRSLKQKDGRVQYKDKNFYLDQEIPEREHGHPAGRVFARSQAYLQKNRQSIEHALRNIELLDPKYNNRMIVRPYQDKENHLENELARKNRSEYQVANGKLPHLNKEKERENSPKNAKGKKLAVRIHNNGHKGKENAGLSHREMNQSQQQPQGKDAQIQEIQQDKSKLAWNRLEMKSRGVQQSVSSFEKEIEKVDRLFMKNSLAMVDLTSVREDLLNLYLSEDIKAHKKRRKLSKKINREANAAIPSK